VKKDSYAWEKTAAAKIRIYGNCYIATLTAIFPQKMATYAAE
jgi:hypothetical protein